MVRGLNGRHGWVLACAALFALALAGPATAQSTGLVRGEVKDASGKPVEGAKVMIDAGNKWNTLEITAKGPRMTVTLNGMQTVDVEDRTHPRGPIALQYGTGTVKFRNVQIRQ